MKPAIKRPQHTRMHPSYLACLLALLGSLAIQPVAADVVLPDVDEKFVILKEDNPTRDAGYVVGDVLERTITLTVKKPYQLVEESLPIVGYEHRYKGQISGIELSSIKVEKSTHSDHQTFVLHLAYQIFTTGKLAKPAALRAEIVKIRNTEKNELSQYRIPSFSFRISPLSVFGAVKLREEMSPFHPPLLLDDSREQFHIKLLIMTLSLSLLGLLYILGVHAWLPRMGAPFAKAYRDIRKRPATEQNLTHAISSLHTAINLTAKNSVFSHTLNEFLQSYPAYAPLQSELERFFLLSRKVFFEPTMPPPVHEPAQLWLIHLCRQLRDCERGLKPAVTHHAHKTEKVA
ncbi:MAG: hypothetical protein FJY53_06035 [Betaproteobacteria bacterium]|nr:hypothetical protein [Betaproteobacteria bacterium]